MKKSDVFYPPKGYRRADAWGYWGPDGKYHSIRKLKNISHVPLRKRAHGFWKSLNEPRELGRSKQVRLASLLLIGVFLIAVIYWQAPGPLFHGMVSNPNYHGEDPNTIIWQANDPGTSGAEFNYAGFNYETSCKGSVNCLKSIGASTGTFVSDSASNSNSPSATLAGLSVNTNDTIVVMIETHGTTTTVSDSQGNTYTKQIETSTSCCSGGTIVSTIWTATASASAQMQVNVGSLVSGSESDAAILRNVVGIGMAIGTTQTAVGATGITTLNFTGINTGDFVLTGMAATFFAATPITWTAVTPSETVIGSTTSSSSPGGGFMGATGMYATANSGAVSYRTDWSGSSCILGGCSVARSGLRIIGKAGVSTGAIAISRSQIGDIDIANSKTLGLNYTWALPTLTQDVYFGMFLTTNSTVPGTANYDPKTDSNVAYLLQLKCSASCGAASPTFRVEVYFLRTLGQDHTISSEDIGCSATAASSGSCFTFLSTTIRPNPSTYNFNQALLNFTGTTQANPTCSIVSGILGGAGCSWLVTSNQDNKPIQNGNFTVITRTLPWLQTSNRYYLGLFLGSTTSMSVQFGFQNLVVYTYNTGAVVNTPPNIDTGGFFGPVVKFFVNGAIWIYQNTLLLLAFATSVVETALNSIGSFFGLGNIGTSLVSSLQGVVTWVNNVFGNIFAQSVNIATAISNGLLVLLQVAGTYWTRLTDWLSGLKDLFGLWWDFVAFFGFGLPITSLIITWLIMGIVMSYNSQEGFLRWARVTWMITAGIFNALWTIGERALDVILKVKGLLVQWL